MTARGQWTAVLVVLVVLGAALYAGTKLLGDELFPVTIGSAAPEFSAEVVTDAGIPGATRTLADYRGEVVLLNIWATWCGPCREEMPSLQKLHERFGAEGLHVVAVSVDDPSASGAIREFAQQYGLTFELLHDRSGAIQRQYHTTGVPETLVIGRDGRILRKQIGATDWNSAANRALIAQLLGVPGDTGDSAKSVRVVPATAAAPLEASSSAPIEEALAAPAAH